MHKTKVCLIPLCIATLTLAGCAATPNMHTATPAEAPSQADIAKVLWHGSEGGWVYRVDAEAAAPRLGQPVQVDAAWLRDYLASLELQFQRADEEKEWHVFTDQQLDHLVPALVNGLAHAQPGQEVVFAVAGPRPGARMFQQSVATTGRVFINDGRLNIIFGRVLDTLFDEPATATYIPGTRTQVRMDWGREVHSTQWAADSKRRDWVTTAVQQGSGTLPQLPESAPVVTADTTTTGDNAAAVSGTSSARSVRARLETLKQLYEDDLISREEYASERAEVLDSL